MKGYNANIKAQNKENGTAPSQGKKQGKVNDITGLMGTKGVQTNLESNKQFAKKFNDIRRKLHDLKKKHKRE